MNQLQPLSHNLNPDLLDPLDEFVRIPGLLRRWEIEQVVTSGAEYRIEEAGEMSDKTQVFAVYRRDRPCPDDIDINLDVDVGVPVRLTFDGEQVTVPARLLPISDEEPLMAVLVVDKSPDSAAALARVRDHLLRSASRSVAPDGLEMTPSSREGVAR
jgi:hypothetical protein